MCISQKQIAEKIQKYEVPCVIHVKQHFGNHNDL